MTGSSPAGADLASHHRVAAALLFGIAAFLLLLGQWRPLEFLDAGGEPWVFVLSEAAAGRYRFGTDIVFTSGPLIDFYKRLFNPATYVSTLILTYAVVSVQALALAVLVARSGTRFFPVILLLALLFTVWRDVLLLLTPLPFALVALDRPTERGSVVMSIVGAVTAGVCTLAKFSIFPLSIGLFLLVDINRLRRRSVPFATPSYLAALYLSFLVFASSGSDFRAFLSGSLETSAGYTEAMAIHGSWIELGLYAVLVIAALASIFMIERRRARLGEFGWESALSLLALALFVWVTIKAGFVRHDLHALFGFSGLALGLGIYAIGRVSPRAQGWPAAAMLAAAIMVSGFYPHVRLAFDQLTKTPISASLADSLSAAPSEIARSLRAANDPRAWLVERTALYETAKAARAKQNPIHGIKGTIDTLPQLQEAFLAAGVDYRPRPTIQEYTTYTHALIERNRKFFTGATAPDYLVFETETIDNRHPALVEGPLWPVFLSRYAPSFVEGGAVVLRRRATPVGDVLLVGETGTGQIGTSLPIRFGEDPVFMSLDLRLTWLGRVAAFVFKLPYLHLGVTRADGTEQLYRLIPGIAREGFFASPMVLTGRDFVALAAGLSADDLPPIKSMRVVGARGSGLAYRSDFSYTTRRLDRARLAQNHDWSLPPEQVATFKRDRAFEAFILAVGRPDPGFRAIAQGLYAHAPRGFPVPVAGADGLRLGFGILPGSWSNGAATDGVCFRALDGAGKTILWERCLDPLKVEEDRALRQETIPLPAGSNQVILITDCRNSCFWDWSYWSEITPIRR